MPAVRCERSLLAPALRHVLALVLGIFVACSAAHAEIVIKIQGVTSPLEKNIRSFLSLSRYAERKSINAETMSRLERRIPAEIRQALEPLGFYSPSVNYQTSLTDATWTAKIDVDPGRPVRLSRVEITVTGPGEDDLAIQRVLALRELREGLRLDHGTYDKVKGDLLRAATNNGYLDAAFTRTDLLIDRTERRARAVLSL